MTRPQGVLQIPWKEKLGVGKAVRLDTGELDRKREGRQDAPSRAALSLI